MFIGDAVPVAGDIPICVNIDKMYKTLSILASKSEINHFYPAWDTTYSAAQLQEKIKSAKTMLQTLESAVHSLDNGSGLGNLVNLVSWILVKRDDAVWLSLRKKRINTSD